MRREEESLKPGKETTEQHRAHHTGADIRISTQQTFLQDKRTDLPWPIDQLLGEVRDILGMDARRIGIRLSPTSATSRSCYNPYGWRERWHLPLQLRCRETLLPCLQCSAMDHPVGQRNEDWSAREASIFTTRPRTCVA